MKESDPLPGLVVLIIVFSLSFGLYASGRNAKLAKQMTVTQALVVKKEERAARFAGVSPVVRRIAKVQFHDKAGKMHTSDAVIKDSVTYHKMKREDRIAIRYDRSDPSRVEIVP